MIVRSSSSGRLGFLLLLLKFGRAFDVVDPSTVLVSPDAIATDETVDARVLVRTELLHPVADDLLRVDHDVHFLRVAPVRVS